MDMKIIKSEKRICSCCMEEHEVKTVLVMNHATVQLIMKQHICFVN